MILFVSGTGTGVGKTVVSTTLTHLLVSIGVSVASLKPIETGCEPDPLDALALAEACRRPELARLPDFYRVPPPVSPLAATLAGQPAPDFERLVTRCRQVATTADLTLIEGAGGLLVPLDEARSMADLARALGSKLLLVAPDRLGVLSDVLAIVECAQRRDLEIAAIVLNRGAQPADASTAHNADILQQRTALPVLVFASNRSETHVAALRQSGLLRVLGLAS